MDDPSVRDIRRMSSSGSGDESGGGGGGGGGAAAQLSPLLHELSGHVSSKVSRPKMIYHPVFVPLVRGGGGGGGVGGVAVATPGEGSGR